VRVLMKETHRGSSDGIEVTLYEAGKKYSISPRLAKIFISAGWAEEIEEEVKTPSPEILKLREERARAAEARKAADRAAMESSLKAQEEAIAAQKKKKEEAEVKLKAEKDAADKAEEEAKKAETEAAKKVPAEKKVVAETPEKKEGVN